MIKSTILLVFSFFICISLVAVVPQQYALAQSSLACEGLSPNQTGADDCKTAADNAPTVAGVLDDALSFLSLTAGAIAVLMLIIAGTKFVTSQGDAGKVTSAKNTVIYAIIGLLIAALAQTIIYFVLDSTVNVNNAPDPTQPSKVICPTGEVCLQ